MTDTTENTTALLKLHYRLDGVETSIEAIKTDISGEIKEAISEIRDATKAIVRLEEKTQRTQQLEDRVRTLEDQNQRFETIFALARWVGFPGTLAVLYLLLNHFKGA